MLHLLKIEWLKLKNYRTFWILSALYLISIYGLNYIVYRIQESIYNAKVAKGMAEMVIGSRPYSFPLVWQMTSYVSTFLLFLPGLLLIISITNEYSYKTHRQNIIDGWSRKDFISVKLVLAVIIAFISTLMVLFTAVGFGLSSGSDFDIENIHYLGYFFIQTLSYSMVALLFSILFKRGALAIGVFFLYSLVLENLIAKPLSHYFNNAGLFLPLESTDALIPLPVFQNVQRQISEPPNYTLFLFVALIYLGIYTFLAIKKFESDDL
ncbi:MAG TPA: ABC transporter permease [Flavitalea sp.]|nr:ABC transporter permease [Flavitalea sp.]